jgi:hypothetical protein
MAYEHKPNTGTIFPNEDYVPNGDPDDKDTNYAGNITINVGGKILKGRLYPKVSEKTGTKYTKVSLWEPTEDGQKSQGSYQSSGYGAKKATTSNDLPF